MKSKKIISLALALVLLSGIAAPTALAEKNEKHISTAEDLMELSVNCSLDKWSEGLTVVLDNDIDLSGVEFYPIPTFSGVFDGGGHTIKNMKTATNGSHQGLFRYIQAEGIVKNLNVEGEVSPEGSQNSVGGIVGVNYGEVENCSFSGVVKGLEHIGGICGENLGKVTDCSAAGNIDGKRATGGIAGKNEGIISNCENKAEVNTSISEKGLELDQINILDISNLELTKANDQNVVTDTGGIAGYSTGVVSACTNRGTIGYQHYGYNVGGVVGRQSGYAEKCENYAEVFGRKDVGGIVGQMEPYMQLKHGVNLTDEIYLLHYLVSDAMGNMSDMSDQMYDSLDSIKDSSDNILDNIIDSNTDNSLQGQGQEQGQGEGQGQGSPDLPNLDDILNQLDKNDQYTEDLQNMADEMGYLLEGMSYSTGEMADGLVKVSEQLANVIVLMASSLSGKDKTRIEDISDELSSSDHQGRVDNCVNYGSIEADKNVGGIAGGMGIEYDFDLEGTLSETVGMSDFLTATYQTKCTSSYNINEGSVVGKKDNIGGICGLSELGTIKDCQGYGSIKSDEGGCVGGIVGRSQSSVRDCFAMCDLDGNANVGGIAGFGSEISGCGSLVGIADTTTACCGAIAGYADVTVEDSVKNNVYVHESVGAIDGISYEGMAVRKSYEEFLKTKGLPERFKTLKMSYMADGKLVGEVEFEYGGSLDESLIPPVPEKNGFSGHWPEYNYSKLYFSDSIDAVYSPRQAAIASKELREGTPLSLALLEGDFSDGAKVKLNPYSGKGPQVTEHEALEMWVMRIEDESKAYEQNYTVRFASPDTESDVKIKVYDGENWNNVNTGRNGSYITFTGTGDTLVFCAISSEKSGVPGPVVAIGSVLLVSLIIVLLTVLKNKKKKSAAAPNDGKVPELPETLQTETEPKQEKLQKQKKLRNK